MGVAPDRVEVELGDLAGGGVTKLGPPVAHVDAEERGEAVEVAVAVLVPDVRPLAADDDRNLVLGVVAAHPGEVHPEVLSGQLLQVAASGRGRGGARGCHRLSFSVYE